MVEKRTRNNKLVAGLLINAFCILLRNNISDTLCILIEIGAMILLIWAMIEIHHSNCA